MASRAIADSNLRRVVAASLIGAAAPAARSAALLEHAARRLVTLLARLSKFQRCGRSR
jgi:hypothetical protein